MLLFEQVFLQQSVDIFFLFVAQPVTTVTLKKFQMFHLGTKIYQNNMMNISKKIAAQFEYLEEIRTFVFSSTCIKVKKGTKIHANGEFL